MNKTVKALMIVVQHLIRNLSNYCLFIGIVFILNYIKITYGVPTAILAVGTLLVLASFIMELNKQKSNTKRY